ncbi:chemotaxis protein CheB [Methylocystis bryophila]|uniref:Sensor protein FixL n=1 Tax=Methylocystis bryophila TaxID=655015 RepID=A0A1W6MUE0_9HYPH|nr:chemotaxis protein CheB [Methylocystis bryophila]ARN81228.1 hypothetical protein B1812_09205 [Methylocystis bryophila]BDV37180.1 chemotaxis methyltransferase [Methylocystis bryophila]
MASKSAQDQAPSGPDPSDGDQPDSRFPTVGIGASAGGVQALQEFFDNLPEDVLAAFVVIVHLDPKRQSELSNIIAAHTKLPVSQVTDRVRLEPRHVYVTPPNRQLLIAEQHLSTVEFIEPPSRRAPIDLFFRSLAAQHGDKLAIILSGAGSDGTVGVKAIKEAGGIILVQDPQEAEYGSMPSSAIATGVVDLVLPVREIAQRLPEMIALSDPIAATQPTENDEETMQRILSHIYVRTGHDFSKYKKSMILRRLARRMQMQRAPTLAAYLSILRGSAEETQALFADLLISVTTFFRDNAVFKILAESFIPRLFDEKGAADAVRVWISGCATGEEAYSMAILLMEERDRRGAHLEIQLFASDIDEAALAFAREGRYPLAIGADLSDERLRRFFTRENDYYRVQQELRDIVLFSKHSLLRDPPFSRLDLISCRNLLIYLDRDLQRQAYLTFHFALSPGGYLLLGASEWVDGSSGLFRIVDRDARIFQRAPTPACGARVVQTLAAGAASGPLPPRSSFAATPRNDASAHRESLERTAPPSAIVDEAFRVIHLSESAGRYLQPSAGALANDITELAREELRFDLRTALHRVFSRGEASLSPPIAVRFNGAQQRVYLQVKPVVHENARAARTAIVFFFEGEALADETDKTIGHEGPAPEEQIRALQQELGFALSQLRTSREEYEGANEELRAANEELQSVNEEYRSTAEELETSKEELQSINEELQTVNSELKSKLDSISRAHSDIQNLMAATDVGILFLDNQLRIKRFTPRVADLFNIASGDEGRSITDFTNSLNCEAFPSDATEVLKTLMSREREVCCRDGACYLMRLRPYRTVENRIDGIVVTFVDISERRHAEEALRDGEARIRAIIDGVADSIVTIDEHGVIRAVNKSTGEMFGYTPEELLGASVGKLMSEPHRTEHGRYIQNYLQTGVAKIIGFGREVEAARKDGSKFPAELRVSEIRHHDERLFIGFLRDLSEKRILEVRLRRLHGDRLTSMAEMATALAHELNQPLSAAANYMQAALRLLERWPERPPSISGALEQAAAQMLRAGRIVSHLHDFISRGDPEKITQSLHAIIRQTSELTGPLMKEHKVDLILNLDAAQDCVLADKVQIQQVLVNLIRNACEAMSATRIRKLTITTMLKNQTLQIDVIDTGVGLSKSVDADFFEPFASTKASGLGVGLSISRSIIEAHQGKIWASAAESGGAKFSFTLPLVETSHVEGQTPELADL